MDEENKKEQKETAPEEPQISISNIGERVQSESDKKVAELNADTERINKAIAEHENAKSRQRLAGVTDAGFRAPEKKETDEEYAARFRRGEANPLKDDGFI